MPELDLVCVKCNDPIESERPHVSNHHILFGSDGKVIVEVRTSQHVECIDLAFFGKDSKELIE